MADFFQRYVMHNFGLKLVSLALAVGLWLAVARDPIAEVPVDVPIELHNIPENLEISSENVPQAQIRVRGPERIIRRLQPSDVHVEIDLRHTPTGERTFDLSGHNIRVPHDLEVVQVIPGQLHLTFDTRLSRQVEVHPRVIGAFAGGYRIERVVADPPTVTITGPQKHVEAVEAAITDPIDVSGTLEHGTFVTHAYVPDPLVQVVRPVPIRVTVIMGKPSADSGGH
ncbi:MAG TPA: CdaR family protein [Terriglobales bacterium]|jgi:YbbR domain-containing protein|nr:CdaR family protein [Terriglobales bacterium]